MPCPNHSPGCNGPTSMGHVCAMCKRAAGVFQPMQKTNTAAGPSNRALRTQMTNMNSSVNINATEFPANSNCALATAAWVCNLASQSLVATTGAVAQSLGRADNRLTFLPNGGGVPEQANGIRMYCRNHPAIIGEFGHRMETGQNGGATISEQQGLQIMNGLRVGSIFAICIQGNVPTLGFRNNDRERITNAEAGPGSTHWLVACLEPTGLVFYDFQPDWQPNHNEIPSARHVVSGPGPTCLGEPFAQGYRFYCIIIFCPVPPRP